MAEFMGHKESQLSNSAEVSSDWIKGNPCNGKSQPLTHNPPTQKKRKTKQETN